MLPVGLFTVFSMHGLCFKKLMPADFLRRRFDFLLTEETSKLTVQKLFDKIDKIREETDKHN